MTVTSIILPFLNCPFRNYNNNDLAIDSVILHHYGLYLSTRSTVYINHLFC